MITLQARWEGEPGDEALVVSTLLCEVVAARRTARRFPWRIYDDCLGEEQLAAIHCDASRARVVRVVEALWGVRLAGGI